MTPAEIRQTRLALGLTQTQFGELLHAALRTVQDWEAGKRNMTASTQELLALKIKERKMKMLMNPFTGSVDSEQNWLADMPTWESVDGRTPREQFDSLEVVILDANGDWIPA